MFSLLEVLSEVDGASLQYWRVQTDALSARHAATPPLGESLLILLKRFFTALLQLNEWSDCLAYRAEHIIAFCVLICEGTQKSHNLDQFFVGTEERGALTVTLKR